MALIWENIGSTAMVTGHYLGAVLQYVQMQESFSLSDEEHRNYRDFIPIELFKLILIYTEIWLWIGLLSIIGIFYLFNVV